MFQIQPMLSTTIGIHYGYAVALFPLNVAKIYDSWLR